MKAPRISLSDYIPRIQTQRLFLQILSQGQDPMSNKAANFEGRNAFEERVEETLQRAEAGVAFFGSYEQSQIGQFNYELKTMVSQLSRSHA